MSSIVNIAAYKFAILTDLKAVRGRLLDRCREQRLKGTILLSTEGINLFVAGEGSAIEVLLGELRSIPGLEALEPKYSSSTHQPFRRMLVRIKREIIAFGVEDIQPALRTSPKLSARTLKQWLDEGRPITLLDTRNDYEVKMGTFKGAIPAGIDQFRDFPKAVNRLPDSLKQQTIVMFCTGGIRCEKAGPYMEREGFQRVYQLDGGILKYFEECGGEHYEGECFVFDQRVGLDPGLTETPSVVCFACQTPLTAEEQADSRFDPPRSCPYCHRSTAERTALNIRTRQQALECLAHPLPGSLPYENRRPMRIPAKYDGLTLGEFVHRALPHLPVEFWDRAFAEDRMLDSEGDRVSSDRLVRSGEVFIQVLPGTVEPAINPHFRILYEDEAIVVIDKSAPLPIHPGGRYNRNTLQYLLERLYAPQKPHAAHRLDANTTGVLVCTRTRHLARSLQPQFERGEVEKTYLAVVQGLPREDSFECLAPISAEPGDLGSRKVDPEHGLPSRTSFRVLSRQSNQTTLLEVRPWTGRTNQIRVHLWQMGLPIHGDPAYHANGALGDAMTLSINDPPLCLHAWRLSFHHPITEERVSFEAPVPSWANQFDCLKA